MDGSSVNGFDHIFWYLEEPGSSPFGLAIDYWSKYFRGSIAIVEIN